MSYSQAPGSMLFGSIKTVPFSASESIEVPTAGVEALAAKSTKVLGLQIGTNNGSLTDWVGEGNVFTSDQVDQLVARIL